MLLIGSPLRFLMVSVFSKAVHGFHMHYTKKFISFFVLAFLSLTLSARPIKLCFTNYPSLADITLCYTNSVALADISVWVGMAGFTDVDVCFVSMPTAYSIDIELVDNPVLADGTICLTDYTALADKTLCITSSAGLADICLGVWDVPTAFTKDIYIKGVDPKRLSLKTKIAVVYSLGLLKKE